MEGEVALHLAASPFKYRDQLDIMQLLLDHGADVNVSDDAGSTPLHHSCRITYGRLEERGTVEGARLLLDHGASIDAINKSGHTPFEVALLAEHYEMAEFLVECGAT